MGFGIIWHTDQNSVNMKWRFEEFASFLQKNFLIQESEKQLSR